MPGQKLLIVEDCEPVAQLLKAALADQFSDVRSVETLAAARHHLRLLEGEPVSLVICSQTLPDGTGDDFRLWMDARAGSSAAGRVPFVLIAGSLPGLRRAGAGFIILSKPFLVEDLFLAIREARVLAGQSPAAN